MPNRSSKTTGPMNNMFADIAKIIEFMEFKDEKTALACETQQSKSNAELYMNARMELDDYTTYQKYWTISMFQEVVPNTKIIDIKRWMQNAFIVPLVFRDNLRLRGREAFISSYVETNEYYRMLSGLPPVDTPESEFIYLTVPMRNQLHASSDPVHMLSPIIQNSYMNTDEYKEVIEKNPDKKYLKYLGMYKIDTFVARSAKDFEIIRYPLNRSDINPNLASEFAKLYNSYREYVMVTLYNPQLENLYVNYRNFMGLLIMISTLMQINNIALEAIHSKNFLDDSIIYEILSMYRIPNSLLLTNEVRRKLVSSIYSLIQKKGTNDVYDDIISILDYEDVKVSKLLLMKGQTFNVDDNHQATSSNDPYFIQVDINDTDPYKTIVDGDAKVYSYDEITNPDPTWWNDDDTMKIVNESAYSMSDSKYIVIEALMPQMKHLFESIYFSRLVLDNKAYTDDFMIEIPELFGTEMVSIYDLIVFIISAMCMNNGLAGDIVTETDTPTATAGFNFDMSWDLFTEYVNGSKYLDKAKVMSFMENLTIKASADITRLYNDVIDPMREWLQYKITNADDRKEFVEYENVYRSLYTYDITRNQFLDDYRVPLENIRIENGISEEEMQMFQHFYPRTFTGKAITVDEFVASRYYPFINRIYQVDWYIHVVIDTEYGSEDRGYVYFHDILNMNDLRELTNPDGTRVFMDYEDGELGWQINNRAVEKALELIDKLDEDALKSAYFVVETPVLNSGGKSFAKDMKLPANIRGGLYKKILHDKLLRDMQGLSNPPATYREYLYRKNPKLYELLTKGDRINRDKDAWLNDVMKIVLAVETELDLHMKYFEQATLGSELFFKPLITLINRFKSTFVRIARTSLKYVFDDKIDAGGNSNMLKIFDEVKFVIHFITLMNRGYESQLGLYDTEHAMKHNILLKDRSKMIEATLISPRKIGMGSIRIVDEVKLYLNGSSLDPSGYHAYWRPGEGNVGRWSEEDDILMKIRKSSERVYPGTVDYDGWKSYRR